MCGIAGYFGKKLPNQDKIQNASTAISHRGPDGEGFYTHSFQDNNVSLIHRRLAILDLESRSDQPFKIQDKILIFNGEIYNYVEVREVLKSLGHIFKTSGDTEVLAHTLLEWGVSGLDRLEGMWAFAWYDESDGSLILSRDRFSEKPLYYWQTGEGFYFGSEIKAIAALAGRLPGKNTNHLIRYMINGYKSLNKTNELFYKEIKLLPHASFMRLGINADTKIAKYWDPKPVQDESMSYAEAVDRTRVCLINSVKLRMRSDVPLAFCMSGGIDSNSLISIAKRELDYDVHGFTIVNTDQRYDEQDLIDDAIKELDVKHTSIPVSPDQFIPNMQKLIAAHDCPISTITFYVHWQLMSAVHEHGYKVAIMGTAADELYTGYYDHHNMYLYEVSGDPELHAKSLKSWEDYQSKIVRNPYLKQPDLFIKDPTFRGHIYLNNDEFASWLVEDWFEEFSETDYGLPLLRNRMKNELFVESVPIILHEDDLNAMYYSIENRSPFLDRSLFDLAYSIPTKHLVQNGVAKSVLRESMRGIVPDSILDNRRKVGFNAPILDLLDMKDPMVREAILDGSPIFDIVKKDKIEDITSEEVLTNSNSKFLFYFLNAKMFLEGKAA